MILLRAKVTTVLLLLIVLSGCSSMRLYSETRDKQGQDLKKTWADVDLKGYFSVQREERKKLLQAELDSVTAHVMAVREATLRKIVNNPVEGSTDGLVQLIQSAIDTRAGVGKEIGGGSAQPHEEQAKTVQEQLSKWRKANITLQKSRASQEINRLWLAADGVEKFACSSFGPEGAVEKWKITNEKNKNLRDEVDPFLDDLKLWCDKEAEGVEALGAVNTSFGGTLATDWREIAEDEAAFEKSKAFAQKAIASYKEAAQAYEEAVKANAASPKPSEEVTKAAAKLKAVLNALVTAQDGFAKEAIAKERVDTLNDLLEKVERSKDPGADVGRTEVVVLLLPKIADDAKALSDLTKTTPKDALLIRRDIERGRADAARIEVTYQEQRIALGRAHFNSRVEETILLQRAKSTLARTTGKDFAKKEFPKAMAAATAKADKVALYDGAARFLDAIGRQHAETRKLELLRIEATNERAINYAEINTRLWTSLIDSVVGQASDYSGGGIKTSDIKDLIQSIALLWIGSGVNK